MPIVDENQVRTATEVNLRLNEAQSAAFKQSRQSLSLDALLAEVERIAELPLDRATTMPREAYSSEEFFAWECDHLFRPGWTALAHVSQLPLVGDFINVDFLGEPLMVVRDKSGEVHVLSRACPVRLRSRAA